MKKKPVTLTLLVLLISGLKLFSQIPVIDLGLFKKAGPGNRLEVRLRPAERVANGSYSGGILTVRFPSSYGVGLSVVPNTALYGYAFAGPVGHSEGYDYYRFQFSGTVNMVNWEKGQEYPLLTLQVEGTGPSNGKYELVTNTSWTRANNGDFYQELNGGELQRHFYRQPLKLRSFTAVGQADRKVKLDWAYESETDLWYSEVEYSKDGGSFGRIGKAEAHGETERDLPMYGYVHGTAQAGVNYYRIRMVDRNGVEEYSLVRAVNFEDPGADFSVFPNPTAGPLVLVSGNLSKYVWGVHYQLVDNSGRVVQFNEVKDENMTLDLSRLPAGAYTLQVMTDQEQLAKFQVVVAN